MKRVFALMLTAALLLGASAAAEKRKVEPLLLPMPLYNQHDYAEPVFTWNERDVTVEESGCGAACVAMVVGYFEPDDAPEPDDVMSLAGKLGLYRGDGLGRDALRLLLDEYGVEGHWHKIFYGKRALRRPSRHHRGWETAGRRPQQRGKDDAEDVSLRHDDSAGKRGLSLYDLRKRGCVRGDRAKRKRPKKR